MCTLRSPIAQASMLMHTWSVRFSSKLAKHVSSSSGTTCGVLTSDTSKSTTAGIHVTNDFLVYLVTRATSGTLERWMFQSVLMISRSVASSSYNMKLPLAVA